MQVAKPNFLSKTNSVLNTAVKNTSCSEGWLRLVIQSILGAITVCSFTLIVLMALQNSHKPQRSEIKRCTIVECKVTCSQAPYLGRYEDHIVDAIERAGEYCGEINVTLNRPDFKDAQIPVNWLSNVNGYLSSLQINGGNLRYIPTDAFMTELSKSIKMLVLNDVNIDEWHGNMLVGLTSLQTLMIEDCRIKKIQRNSLRPVSSTLQKLIITSSGVFNPANLTGTFNFPTLSEIVLTLNDFGTILGRNSFISVQNCRILGLSSSHIKAIGLGAFDYLKSVEFINLSNNLLVTLPDGIFDRIATLNTLWPMIDLQRNRWHCNCNLEHLRILNQQGMTIGDTKCSMPDEKRDISFSMYTTFCPESQESDNVSVGFSSLSETKIYVDGACNSISEGNINLRIISPVPSYQCSTTIISLFTYVDLISISSEAISRQYSSFIEPFFYLNSTDYSLIEINSRSVDNESYGLIWFQSRCPNYVYCMHTFPRYLRIYNVNPYTEYTICAINNFGSIQPNSCIGYNPSNKALVVLSKTAFWIYVLAASAGIALGATVIFGVVREHPALLKGSKRILLVKHKVAEALVLPPKIPEREDKTTNMDDLICNIDSKATVPPNFYRSGSTRSNKSIAPSYISALQPSEEQMVEWRLRHHFDNSLTITSITKQDFAPISWIYDSNNIP